MLRTALALLSSLQIGARIKEQFDRALRQAVVIAVAAVLLVAAAVFALLAFYHALISHYQLSATEAAAIMAGVLLLIGLIALATVPLIGREPKRPKPAPLVSAGDTAGLVDVGVGKAMEQVGPLPLLALAFFAGLLAGRK
jgi:hypothetical protein